MTVVVVMEAHNLLRETLMEGLASVGFRPVAAECAQSALRLLGEKGPCTLLLGTLHLGEAQAPFLRALRAHPHHGATPVVVMDGSRELLEVGASEVLRHPVTFAQLEAALRRHVA
jgi:DNA-binding response OmpR family regulator